MKNTRMCLVFAAACALAATVSRGAAASADEYPVQNKVTWTEGSLEREKVHLAPKPQNDLRKLLTEGAGQATIAFVVDVNGNTTHVQIAKATSQEFGDLAKKAVEQWKFSPGQMNGKPVAVRMMFPVARK